MQEQAIYGKYGDYLPKILEDISQRIKAENKKIKQETGHKLFEHFNVGAEPGLEEAVVIHELHAVYGLARLVEDAEAHRGHQRKVTMIEIEERRVGKECRSRWSPYH